MTPAMPPSAPPSGMPPGAAPVRRPRSPGRRSFQPGTDEQWQQALSDPELQKALSDPQVQQALAQNLDRLQASALPRPRRAPMHFQQGSSVEGVGSGISRAEYNQLLQQLQALQAKLATQQASMPSSASAGTGTGNTNTSILGGGGSGITGNIGNAIGSIGSNFQNAIGKPTIGNTLGPAVLGGVMGLGSTKNPGMSALVGAGTAGLLSYLIRKMHQPAADSSSTDPSAGITTGPNLGTDYTQTRPFAPGATSAPGAMPGTPDQFQMPATEEALGNIPGEAATLPLSAANMPLGELEGEEDLQLARGGQLKHDDAAQDRAQMLGILKEKKLTKARGGFHADSAEDAPSIPLKKPKSVLLRKPMAKATTAIPVISTTIVLSKKKPKGATKKSKGGAMKASAHKKPEKKVAPAPFAKGGHVQVPRGTGAAIRGKRFQGIY